MFKLREVIMLNCLRGGCCMLAVLTEQKQEYLDQREGLVCTAAQQKL
jgi:hypothetical protein